MSNEPSSSVQPDLSEMALKWYGYGRWDCPYWFIGPEPGQALSENHDLQPRLKAWRHAGGGELCDCRDFHNYLSERRWHGDRPKLQPTWRPLMLLLMTFLATPADQETLRDYQRDRWGSVAGGETCVIELSGLAANSFEVPRDRTQFRQERIGVIRERMLRYKPSLVVMYGKSEKQCWEQIAGSSFPFSNVLKIGSTIFTLTPHPVSRGQGNAYWMELGKALREELTYPISSTPI